MNKYNYYEILELDKDENDIYIIKEQIEIKKREWNRWKNQGTPKQQNLAKEYFAIINDIERLTIDEYLRKQHQQEYKAKILNERKQALQKLDEALSYFDNTINKEQYNKLKNKFKKILTETEIDNRLKKLGISIVTKNNKKKKNNKPKLESAKFDEINNLLKLLDKKDLYDFLDANSNFSIDLLQKKADEISIKTIGKTDNKNSIKSKLAGLAKSIFKNEREKNKYDNSLSYSLLSNLNDILEIVVIKGYLEKKDIDKLLLQATKYGINEDVALEYIYEYTEKKKCKIINSLQKNKTILKCIFCGEILNENDINCPYCKEKVSQKCPICNSEIKIYQKKCKCGFMIADLIEIKKMFIQAEKYIKIQQYEEAENILNKIISIWNFNKAKETLKELLSIKNEQKKYIEKIESLISKKFYFKAQTIITEYLSKYKTNQKIEKYKNEINKKFNIILPLIQEAEYYNANKKFSLAIDKYINILDIVKDHKKVKEKITQIPLTVTNLAYQLNSNNLFIKWNSPINGVSFLIIRKKESIPLNNSDGEEIGETTNMEFVDYNIKKSEIFYYAIYIVKNNIVFNKGSILGPIFIPAPIENVSIRGLDSKIEISWEKPINSLEVEIYKKATKNNFTKQEAEKLAISSNIFIDTRVKNDITYGYLFSVKYKHPKNNKIIYSEDKIFYAVPTTPPKPLKNINYEIKNNYIYIEWININENIKIALFEQKPLYSFNETIDIKVLQNYKLYTSKGNNNIIIPIKSQGIFYIVPFSIKNNIAVVGKELKVVCLNDVDEKEIKTIIKDNKLFIHFNNIPLGVKEFLLVYRNDRFAKNFDEDGNFKKIYSIKEYKKNNNKLILELNNKGLYYFTLYVYDSKSNIVSKGAKFLENIGEIIRINYRIRRKKSFIFFGKIKELFVELNLEKKRNLTLEDIVVVFNSKNPPLEKNDGSIIKRMKYIKFKNRKGKIKISDKYWDKKGYIKIFFNNPQRFEYIRLLPKEESQLKL